MKKALTGIQATGELTLGNYIGAMKPLINIQNKYEIYAFVADLHSIVLPNDENIKENSNNVLRYWKAAGLDTNKAKVWKQSDVSAHSELNWLLTTQTTLGELQRMTQFKDKSEGLKLKNGTSTIPTGLLIYPVLQSADILLFDADVVVVGDDQKQHLELTRDIAQRFNNKYGETFVLPETMTPEAGFRVMALQEPTKKMSKSDLKVKNTIFLSDDEKSIRRKINSAMTDDENNVYLDWDNKPGVANLLSIYAALKDITIEEAEAKHKGMGYGEFKTSIADVVVETIMDIQSKLEEEVNFLATDEITKLGNSKVSNVKTKMGF